MAHMLKRHLGLPSSACSEPKPWKRTAPRWVPHKVTVAVFGNLSEPTLIVDTLSDAIWASDGNLGVWNGLSPIINSKEIHHET
jgi:hypothetical protein